MESSGLVFEQFSRTSQLLARDGWKEADLDFDEARREFEAAWRRIYQEFGNKPEEAPVAAKKLIEAQPRVTGLTLAMARCDTTELFGGFKSLLEFILRRMESGYPAVAAVPHVQAGFLYMAAVVMALHWRAWSLFEKLLTSKFEWSYQSGRSMFSYAFDLPYFFHPEAFSRDGGKVHDFYRKELAEPEIVAVTALAGDRALETYLQAQMLMCLKVAQLREADKAEMVSIWPDFGRFYGERVARLFDRAYADRQYAQGLLKAFNEEPDTFFRKLNNRLGLIRSVFWRGAPYFYEWLTSWEPRETPV